MGTKTAFPAQILKLETAYRFGNGGEIRKEVHTLAKINNALGAREFSRLSFPYDRNFQTVEIPLVRITHANGGSSELLPSAVSDAAQPAVESFPAYQELRIKSVRLLGLQEGDTVEYRVITTTKNQPLAPDFWLEHSFDPTGQVEQEEYTLNLPAGMDVKPRTAASVAAPERTEMEEGGERRVVYRWNVQAPKEAAPDATAPAEPEILLTTFASWEALAAKLAGTFGMNSAAAPELSAKIGEITREAKAPEERAKAFYAYVSKNIATVDLPLGATGYAARPVQEVLKNGYGTAEDKVALLVAIYKFLGIPAEVGFVSNGEHAEKSAVVPTALSQVLVRIPGEKSETWLAPGLEVAPFGAVPANLRGKTALLLPSDATAGDSGHSLWTKVPGTAPYAASQDVQVMAKIAEDGKLTAAVKYKLRGENELLLRLAFHQTPKEKWNEIANLLAVSDGFRGQITKVDASDPTATEEPFTVEYEIAQPKFVDWSKQPVRIPALLPQIGLPEPPSKAALNAPNAKIDLGTPLAVKTRLALTLPAGTTVQAPPGTKVERDYATYSSQYAARQNTLTAERQVNFVLEELPAERAVDLNAFLRAAQNDQAQVMVLVGAKSSSK